jgi:fatty acid desaturase
MRWLTGGLTHHLAHHLRPIAPRADLPRLHATLVPEAARAAGVPVVAVAGQCLLTPAQLQEAGIGRAYALTDESDDRDECFTRPGPLLERIGARIAHDQLDGSTGGGR